MTLTQAYIGVAIRERTGHKVEDVLIGAGFTSLAELDTPAKAGMVLDMLPPAPEPKRVLGRRPAGTPAAGRE